MPHDEEILKTLKDFADGILAELRKAQTPPEMTIREETIDGYDVVIVPEKAKNMLLALGWTPPRDEPATVVLPPLTGQPPIVEVYGCRYQVTGWDFDRNTSEGPTVTCRLGPTS